MGDYKRNFVIGDIHGAYHAFRDCLAAVQFDYEKDLLICLGDVCDGWPQTKESIDEMLKMKHLVYILGNHDKWAFQWFLSKKVPDIWTSQGGNATMHSYREGIPEAHVNFMKRADYSTSLITKYLFMVVLTRQKQFTSRIRRCFYGTGVCFTRPLKMGNQE